MTLLDGMAMPSRLRYLRYVVASLVGSVLTVFVVSLREAAVYGNSRVHFRSAPGVRMRVAALHSPAQALFTELSPPSGCGVRPQPPLVRNGVWQVVEDVQGEVMVFGAYHDDRGPGPAVVRVFGVAALPARPALLCLLWGGDPARGPVVTHAALTAPGRGFRTRHDVLYQEYLFTCPTRPGLSRPRHVSLVFRHCQNSTIHAPVVYARREPGSVQFGVCVAAAYGEVAARRLTEWAELLALLGVTEINVYPGRIAPHTARAFAHFARRGLMVVRPAPSPLRDSSFWAAKLAVIPGLNDCVYRNMYRHNYTVIVDFDEVIVPHMHASYTAMLADLRTFHPRLQATPGLLLFRNAYFFLDLGATSSAPGDAAILAHTRRIDVSPRGYAAKSLFDPRACVVAWNHFCVQRRPRTAVLNVDPLYALSHHYKPCHFPRAECQKLMSRNVTDTAVLRFKVALRRRLRVSHLT